MKNIACRIFKEQVDLINRLPMREREIVFYNLINNLFNQFENQIDNQIENQIEHQNDNQIENQIDKQFDNQIEHQIDAHFEHQNENAYISVSISKLGISIYNILYKTIRIKKYSDNYGGKRIRARVKADESKVENTPVIESTTKTKFTPPSLSEVLDYAKAQSEIAGMGGFLCSPELAEAFYLQYDSQGWVRGNEAQTPIRNWQSLLRKWARENQIKEQTQKKEQEYWV